MLLQLHGVPIRSASQRSNEPLDTEPRNVVGRGLRWPATQRRLQVPQPAQADVRSRREELSTQEPVQESRDQPRSPAAEEPAAAAAHAQPSAASQLSAATDVDMRDAEASPGYGPGCRAPVDVHSMVAATTALLAEVCPDRGPSDLHASAARYVRLLVESTSGERSAQPAAPRPAAAKDHSAALRGSSERAAGPQQYHVHFGSQVLFCFVLVGVDSLASHLGSSPWLLRVSRCDAVYCACGKRSVRFTTWSSLLCP